MAKGRIGDLPPRYSFILNPYTSVRLSKCPQCSRPTHARKFALFIHIDKFGSLALGKTCRYCARCEMLIVHQDELEAELAHNFTRIAPEVVGNKYLVLGTVDKKVWQRSLQEDEATLSSTLPYVAEFKKALDLKMEGGWMPA